MGIVTLKLASIYELGATNRRCLVADDSVQCREYQDRFTRDCSDVLLRNPDARSGVYSIFSWEKVIRFSVIWRPNAGAGQ